MCRWVLLWVSLTSLVVAIPEEHQYCAVRYRRLCQGKGRHIACQFPDSGPGPSCERYTQIKFTNDLKHFITHYLNRRRQRIAAGNERVRGGIHLPKPQIMMLVEWDRELALLAQRLADQCHFVHDDCRATVRYPYAGQTVGEVRWRRSSESDELSAQRAIRRVLDAWWGERRRVQPKQLTAPFRLTAKGTVWGHFSQLAVWNLQAVGCGAVRHGAHHPRLLLVCDFSHTNMLGQRTLVSGNMAPCPIHTQRRPRTAYPSLCAPITNRTGRQRRHGEVSMYNETVTNPRTDCGLRSFTSRYKRILLSHEPLQVRHPMPAEPEEIEMEDNYEDDDDDDSDVATVEVGDVPTPSLWMKRTEKRQQKPKIKTKSTPIREFPEETRKVDIKHFRGVFHSSSTLKESIIQKLDRELEQKTRNKVNVKYKEAQNTFDSNQFENIVRNDWRTRKKPNYGQWRQNQENPENLEEVIPLTLPRHELTETLEPTVAEIYRPTLREDLTEHVPRTGVELYRPTAREDITDHDMAPTVVEMYRPTIADDMEHDGSFRQRWRQSRVRPQRPGANALLYTSTGKQSKKEFIASLNLDKEDIDQLFRDTGFNVHWRKHTT